MTAKFVPARVPLVDPRTGIITREWYLLFQGVFQIGGGIDDTLIATIAPYASPDAPLAGIDRLRDEVSLAPPPVPPPPAPDDLAPPPMPPLFIAADDVLPAIGALRDEVAMLRRAVDDLRKGGIIL